MKTGFLQKTGGIALCTLTLLLSGALSASAQTVLPFASFTQGTGSPSKPFRMINSANHRLNGVPVSGANSRFGFYRDVSTTNGITTVEAYSIPVNFQYQAINSYGSATGENIAAMMTFTSVVNSPAFGTGDNFLQLFDSIQMSFTAVTPVVIDGVSRTNLLTLNATGAFQRGSTVRGSLFGTESAEDDFVVAFNSDFLDFSGIYPVKSFNLTFNSIEPSLPNNPTSNSYLQSFRTDGVGLFSSNPLPPPSNRVPEPATAGLLVLGVVAGVAARRRK